MAESEQISGDTAPRRRRIGLATVLVGGVTLLMLLAVGSVLALTLTGATQNTFSLLGARATTILDLVEARVDGQFDPVVSAAEDLSAQFADGRLNLDDRHERAFQTFTGVLTALPQVTAVIYAPVEGQALRVTLTEGIAISVPDAPALVQRQNRVLDFARSVDKPSQWLTPIWIQAVGQPVITVIAPVRRGDDFKGTVILSVTMGKIGDFLRQMTQTNDLHGFIVYDGSWVLGHPELDNVDFQPGSGGNPLPKIEDLADPALALFGGGGERALTLLRNAPRVTDARIDNERIVITRDTDRFGERPWTLGVMLLREDVGNEVQRLIGMSVVGLLILVIAVFIGFMFARRLNRQISRLVTSASALTRLEVANAPLVPDSRISELSDAAQAFNRMIGALKLFETYVPKQLVLGLVQRGETIETTEERILTIMFTDIRGFSTLAEHMGAAEIAELLNTHFEMLASAIEAEGGTVDKYIGDAIMAFWGAPEQVPDHAARALRAAAEIQRRVRADNDARRARGDEALRIRVGIHTGQVIVGNIGSKNRVNYTVVGDAVNTASRIDSLAKEIATEEDCIILTSGDTRDLAGPADTGVYDLQNLGEREIRGREGTVSIFQLDANVPSS
ncbi:MAG: HAMP domain-containing protein [Rhodospirillaceae bacterium]|jgi:class 3 adenylate cyclase|nr:HAMP domain-containing protein [Rhodospirillaceae bacterium]